MYEIEVITVCFALHCFNCSCILLAYIILEHSLSKWLQDIADLATLLLVSLITWLIRMKLLLAFFDWEPAYQKQKHRLLPIKR